MNLLTDFMRPLRAGTALAAFAALFVIFMLPAHAELADVRNTISERMRANKQSFSPSSVTETLIKGLYRWDQGGNTGQIYINEAATLMLLTDGRKIVQWDQPVRNPEPITEVQKNELLSEMTRNIRFDKLIHILQGNGANQVLLLSAFDCPVCVQFERMAESLGSRLNADIYILPSTLQPSSNAKASTVSNIWCAQDNAAVWRATLTKGARGYFVHPGHSCVLSYRAMEDVAVILRTFGTFKGYPFMVFGNGEWGTPEVDADTFMDQLNKSPGKEFWAHPQPEKYADFRAIGVASSTVVGTTHPLKGIFQRFRRPTSGNRAQPANVDDPSGLN